jgi:hypothetical protein
VYVAQGQWQNALTALAKLVPQQFDDCGRDNRERTKEKDPCNKVQGLGLVAVLTVNIEKDEQRGSKGKEKEFQHHRTIGSRNTR